MHASNRTGETTTRTGKKRAQETYDKRAEVQRKNTGLRKRNDIFDTGKLGTVSAIQETRKHEVALHYVFSLKLHFI